MLVCRPTTFSLVSKGVTIGKLLALCDLACVILVSKQGSANVGGISSQKCEYAIYRLLAAAALEPVRVIRRYTYPMRFLACPI